LKAFGGGWAGIISGGVDRRGSGQARTLDLVYVDGFGGEGQYERDASGGEAGDDPIWGSPIVGIRAIEGAADLLRSGTLTLRVTAVIVEKGADEFPRLLENLAHAGLRTPVLHVASMQEARYGYINVIQDDFRDVVPTLIPWLIPGAFVLALIDPYGTGMPMSALAPIVGRQKTDCIILFPWMDIQIRGGSACKPISERTSEDRGNITRVTGVFGCDAWIPTLCNDSLSSEEKEGILADLYFHQLRELDADLAVKAIPLRLSRAQSRVVYHLFLTTRNGDGALKMNEVLRSAGIREVYTLWADEMERRRAAEAAREQDSLFGSEAMDDMRAIPVAEREVAEMVDVKQAIISHVREGEAVTFAALKKRFANDVYTESEIKKALSGMKREGLISGSWQTNRESITLVR
jgi:three-Cys-motif partner protein